MKSFYEKNLVQKLDKILKREFETNLAFHEFSAGYGIADLVFAPHFSFKKNLIERPPLTNFNSLKLLMTLQNEVIYKLTDILGLFDYLTMPEVKKQVNLLASSRYLEKIEKDTYIKIKKDTLSPIKKIIAIEVKLNDHKSGLTQARRYQYFADESYLAILKTAEKNINFEEFNKYNIGLILFNDKTNEIEIKCPQKNNLNYENSVNLLAKEMMVSRFINFAF